jgi:hypothetical protein
MPSTSLPYCVAGRQFLWLFALTLVPRIGATTAPGYKWWITSPLDRVGAWDTRGNFSGGVLGSVCELDRWEAAVSAEMRV